jgi:Uma2 family endonuclease
VEVSIELETQTMAMPRPDLATAAAAEQADLERLWQTMDLPGHRVELICGQIVVSPTAGRRHSNAVDELMSQLFLVKRRRGWRFHPNLTVHIPATSERLIPDLMVAPDHAAGFGDDELLAPGVLLVAEVVSPSSRRPDRDTKNRAYAQGGIPLYLLIDGFSEPPAVTLFSDPGDAGYRHSQLATAGERLRLSDPFGVKLDTARLLA